MFLVRRIPNTKTMYTQNRMVNDNCNCKKECTIQIPHFWVNKLPKDLCANAIYFVKTQTGVQMWVTSINKVATLIGDSDQGVVGITSPDASLTISQVEQDFQISLSQTLKDLIQGALQPNDNISELTNDVGYITLADIPEQGLQTIQEGDNIQVDSTDPLNPIVSVVGLGSAAFTETTDYATAQQGQLADTALQPNDNISELQNDAGYITQADVPPFDPTDYDLNDFNNASPDPYARLSEVGGATNLTYTPSPTQGTVNSDTGTDAILPATNATNAGLFLSAEKTKLASIEAGADVTDISIQDMNGNEQFRVTDSFRLNGGTFNPTTKQFNVSPLKGFTVYLKNTGNDATAQEGNPDLPFKTLDGVCTWLFNQTHKGLNYTIETLDNSTYTYTVKRALAGLNITNNSGASIYFESAIIASTQLYFRMPTGTLYFRRTPTSDLDIASFKGQVTQNVYQDVANVVFLNTTGLAMDRGVFRNLAVNLEFFKWDNLNLGTANIAIGNFGKQTIPLNIGTITNANTIPYPGAEYFLSGTDAGNLLNVDYNINHYINSSNSNQKLYGCENLKINQITSANAYTTLDPSLLLVDRNVTYNNVRIQGNAGNSIRRIQGQGTTITFNNTLAGTTLFVTGITQGKTVNGYDKNSQTLIKNVNIRVLSTSTTVSLFAVDLRGGAAVRKGAQFILDDVEINMENSAPIMLLQSYFDGSDNPADYQILFRNSVRIFNNNYLLSGTLPTNRNIPTTFLVQEAASVFHDFGKIHVYGQFPPINQFNVYNNIRKKEVRIDQVSQIINQSIRSDYTYVIDGILTLTAGQYIDIPTNGATIIGYGFDVSKIVKNVAGEPIFRSVSGGVRNLILKDLDISSGLGSVFNLTDIDGTSAIEFNDVNFNNCNSLGVFNGFRQFTGTTCGIYGCGDGFTLTGTWNGFKLTNTNVSGFGSTGTIIKNGTSTLFRNRVYLDLNLILPTGAKITDLTPSNFQKPKSFQLRNNNVVVNNLIDDSVTTLLIPNISVNDSVSDWTNNVGIKNSGVNNMITSSASVTLPNNDRIVYLTFTGTTSTFTLPSLASSQGIRYMIINRGSGDITVNTNSGANDIDESGVFMNTYTIPSETTLSFFNNTLKFVIFNS